MGGGGCTSGVQRIHRFRQWGRRALRRDGGGGGGGGTAGYIHGKSGVHVHIHGVLLASVRGVGGFVPLVAL